MDFDSIEKSRTGEKRTVLYFAYPYCASEWATNENLNRMIRRFFAKGSDFTHINQNVCADVRNWMNSYPRKLLNGSTALTQLRSFMGLDFLIPF